MGRFDHSAWPIVSFLALVACTPGPRAGPAAQDPGHQPAVDARRTLTISVRVEPQTIAAKSLQQAGVTLETSRRLFNAGVALMDNKGAWHPYLVEALPALDTASWQVEPDGRMVTTFRLRPNIVWHDGTPLSAEDFVFAYQVYATPDLGQSRSPPMSVMADVVATGDRTFEVRWLRPYAQANVVGAGGGGGGEFAPLPRNFLADAFRDASRGGAFDAFVGHPYWTRDYVGLGPYKLERWEPGAFIEAVAFDGHVLGRPKIERVKFVFIPDANTTLSNTLAGEVHFAADDSIRFEQTRVLKREWGLRSGGMILSKPNLWRASYFQLRPDVASPRSVLDLRVRRALAHAIDRIALNNAMFEGENMVGDTVVAPSVSYYVDLERSITKYPFDLRRSEQLMRDAGFSRTGEAPYAGSDGRVVGFEAKTNAATQQEQEQAILASGWRQAGFDMQEVILPAAQAQDSQVRASFTSIFSFSSPQGEVALSRFTTDQIPRPENRWTGNNRGGWSNPEFDRLSEAFTVALDQAARRRGIIQMAKIFTEEVPGISLYFNAIPIAFVSELKGPQESVPEADWSWNVYEWEFR